MSKDELELKFEERETLLQVGAIFHVVIGARQLKQPGDYVLNAVRSRYPRFVTLF